MARKYVCIADLKSGIRIDACYLLQNYQLRPKKDGTNFVTMVLRDASGKITGIMWDNFEAITGGSISENDFVDISGDVLTYNNQLQLKVNKIVKVKDCDVDASFFLPVSPVPIAQLEAELKSAIAAITDPDYRIIIDRIFGSSVFMDRFRRAPSAVSMHQAYIGGLFEHTMCVVRNALRMAENYDQANKSLLITAALLHDIGKTVELVYDKKIAYSDVGRLLGHISIGNSIVEVECSRIPDYPLSKKVLLQHVLLSHHGQLEYGSPKRPKTLEALIVHHADLLDAQLSNYMEYASTARKTGTRWEYSSMFERYIYGILPDVEGCELMREITARDGLADDTIALSFEQAIPSDQLLEEAGAGFLK